MLQHQNYWLVCASVKADDSSGHPVTLKVDRSTSMVKARVNCKLQSKRKRKSIETKTQAVIVLVLYDFSL